MDTWTGCFLQFIRIILMRGSVNLGKMRSQWAFDRRQWGETYLGRSVGVGGFYGSNLDIERTIWTWTLFFFYRRHQIWPIGLNGEKVVLQCGGTQLTVFYMNFYNLGYFVGQGTVKVWDCILQLLNSRNNSFAIILYSVHLLVTRIILHHRKIIGIRI